MNTWDGRLLYREPLGVVSSADVSAILNVSVSDDSDLSSRVSESGAERTDALNTPDRHALTLPFGPRLLASGGAVASLILEVYVGGLSLSSEL
jgi:hypothetical protein